MIGFGPDRPQPPAGGESLKTVCVPDGRGRPRSYLHVSGSWRDGRLQPMTFSVKQMICCSLFLSFAVAATYQMVMVEVRMDSTMEVYKCTITVFGTLVRKRKDSTEMTGETHRVTGADGAAFS